MHVLQETASNVRRDSAGGSSDEQLERAMAASMSSVKSHDILTQLKQERRMLEQREEERRQEENDLLNFQVCFKGILWSYNRMKCSFWKECARFAK